MTENSARPEREPAPRFGLPDLVLLLVAALVPCWVHLHPFLADARPTHFDEWRNAGRILGLLETGRLVRERPTTAFPDLNEDIGHRNLQGGFVVTMAAASRLLGLDPVRHHKVFALFCLLVLAGGTYRLAQVIGGDRASPVLAVLFLGLIPSNVNLLGPAYGVPLVLSLGLVCTFLVGWLTDARAHPARSLAVMAASALALVWVYPLSAVFVGLTVTAGVLVRPAALLERTRATACVVLGGSLVFLLSESPAEQPGPAIAWAVEELVFLDRWHLHQFISFPLSYLVPPLLLALAAVGGFAAWRRGAAIATIGLLLPLSIFFLYRSSGYAFAIPYQRLALYLGTFVAVLGGLGGAVIASRLAARFSTLARPLHALFLVAAVLGVFWTRSTPQRIGRLQNELRPSAEVLESLEWIHRNGYPEGTVVHAHPAAAPFVRSLTRLRPSDASIDALLNGRGLAVFRCDERYDLVVGIIRCDNYEPVFATRGVVVYEPRPPDE